MQDNILGSFFEKTVLYEMLCTLFYSLEIQVYKHLNMHFELYVYPKNLNTYIAIFLNLDFGEISCPIII